MMFERKQLVPALLGLLLASPALAAHPEPPAGTNLNDLPQIAAHIDTGAGIENIQERRDAVTEEEVSSLTLNFGPARFTLSGLIEAEASLTHPEGGDEDDDLRLSTVQIGLDAEFTPWLGGHIIGLWEDEATEPMVVDEAVLSLTSPWQFGGQTPALHLGRQYLPFGRFDSAMISDPLTLELGETHTTAAVLALSGERWSASFGGFKGAIDNGDSGVDSWVAAVEATPYEGVTIGASWISDLAESDAGLVDKHAGYDIFASEDDVEPLTTLPLSRVYRDEVAAWSAFVSMQFGTLGVTAEYLAALEDFPMEIAAAGEDLTGRRPEAWNLEVSWQATDKLQLAGRYEEAAGYQADVRRYGATASYGLCDYALLAVEYLHADAVGNDPAHSLTAQLAVEF